MVWSKLGAITVDKSLKTGIVGWETEIILFGFINWSLDFQRVGGIGVRNKFRIFLSWQ